jgi:putative drug exporter of the RND superfamily
MHRLARWCVSHRLAVIAAWLVVLAGAVVISSSTGSNYSSGNSLSGTQSATAQSLLQRASPAAAGDSEQIVFATHGGAVTAAPIRTEIQPMLAKPAQLPNVASVTSPYAPAGSKQISRDGTVAFATVNFTKDASAISSSAATAFVNTARAPSSHNLQVELLGQVAASTNPSSQISTLIGVAAALVVLLVVFGSVLAALLPLLSTAIALGAAISLVGALSNSISMASFTQQLCILIGLGVGIDYSLFILTRTRTGLRHGLSTQDAVINASATAGRAVLFAGITVCIALCGMFIVGVSVLSGAAIAASISVLLPMLAAQTLLPALNGILGRRVLTHKQRKALDAGQTSPAEASAGWARWAEHVQNHRLGFGLAALAVMIGLAIPATSLRLGSADYGTDPTTSTTTTHHAYELLVRGFGPGFSGPLELVAPIHTTADTAAFGHVVAAVSHTHGVAAITPTQILPAGPGHPAVAVAEAYPTGSPQDASTSNLITNLRDTVIPRAVHGTSPTVYVGGQTALTDDLAAQLSSKLPLFVGAVVALSFLLLMVVFRSLLIPATAAVMNLLSAGAAFGVITRRLPKRLPGHARRCLTDGTDLAAGADPHVRRAVRTLDGLRGVPGQPHARGMAEDPRQHQSSQPRPGDHRPNDHRARDHHDRRVPRVRAQHRPHDQTNRTRHGHGDPNRRHHRPDRSRPGDHAHVWTQELAAAGVARPAPPSSRHRRRGDREPHRR